jgi:hypothetical protein
MDTKDIGIIHSPPIDTNFPFYYKKEIIAHSLYKWNALSQMSNLNRKKYATSLSSINLHKPGSSVGVLTPKLVGQLDKIR